MQTLFVATFSLAVIHAGPSSGGEFEILRSVIANGGGQAAGGQFVVQGTTGQADAAADLSGGNSILAPGFWGAPGTDLIFQDAFEVSP